MPTSPPTTIAVALSAARRLQARGEAVTARAVAGLTGRPFWTVADSLKQLRARGQLPAVVRGRHDAPARRRVLAAVVELASRGEPSTPAAVAAIAGGSPRGAARQLLELRRRGQLPGEPVARYRPDEPVGEYLDDWRRRCAPARGSDNFTSTGPAEVNGSLPARARM